jgi:hypothetical protein
MMKMTPANPAVGNWRNNGPEVLDLPNRSHFLAISEVGFRAPARLIDTQTWILVEPQTPID